MFDVSIIIPVFNEGNRLPDFLKQLVLEIDASKMAIEIIIVDDGSRQPDKEIYRTLTAGLKKPYIQYIENETNSGKGAVVRQGLLTAQGNWIGYVDADGATSAKEILRLIKLGVSLEGYDAFFGSRIKMLGYQVSRSLKRHLIGRIFVTMASLVLGVSVYDPQCGCKFFRKEKFIGLIKQSAERKFLLDIELIYLAVENKLRLIEIPINWQDKPDSKVNVAMDGFKMFMGLWEIKKNHPKSK